MTTKYFSDNWSNIQYGCSRIWWSAVLKRKSIPRKHYCWSNEELVYIQKTMYSIDRDHCRIKFAWIPTMTFEFLKFLVKLVSCLCCQYFFGRTLYWHLIILLSGLVWPYWSDSLHPCFPSFSSCSTKGKYLVL